MHERARATKTHCVKKYCKWVRTLDPKYFFAMFKKVK
jgi:hypothetical protein